MTGTQRISQWTVLPSVPVRRSPPQHSTPPRFISCQPMGSGYASPLMVTDAKGRTGVVSSSTASVLAPPRLRAVTCHCQVRPAPVPCDVKAIHRLLFLPSL